MFEYFHDVDSHFDADLVNSISTQSDSLELRYARDWFRMLRKAERRNRPQYAKSSFPDWVAYHGLMVLGFIEGVRYATRRKREVNNARTREAIQAKKDAEYFAWLESEDI